MLTIFSILDSAIPAEHYNVASSTRAEFQPTVVVTSARIGARFRVRFYRNRLATLSLIFLVAVAITGLLAPILALYSPDHLDLANKFARPDARHWLGTDQFGRDMLSRLMVGARISLSVGIVSVVISVVIGTAVGLIAGTKSGAVDAVLMRFTDGLLSIPAIFLLLTALSSFGRTVANIVVIIGVTRWMATARIVRAEALRNRGREFVLAAYALGTSPWRIVWRHILPQAVPSIIVSATFSVAQAILIESGLSYLGLGIQPPTASWGNMLSGAQNFVWIAPLVAVFPGALIFLTVLAFNSLGDGLRDALDPRLRQ